MGDAAVPAVPILLANGTADRLLTPNEAKIKLASVCSWYCLSPDLDDCLFKQSEDSTVYSLSKYLQIASLKPY